nr:MAG TPA: hypothetical protein [Caudoviricetes sp.]
MGVLVAVYYLPRDRQSHGIAPCGAEKRGKKKTPALSLAAFELTLELVIKLGRFYVMPWDMQIVKVQKSLL